MNKNITLALFSLLLFSSSYFVYDLAIAEEQKSSGEILYYKHPMGLADTSLAPKKDPMGMDYIPFYGEEDSGGTIKVNLNKVQKLGVKVTEARSDKITKTIRALGVVQINEKLQQVVSPRFEGWIEILHASTTGLNVVKGKSLMEVYSPELVVAQQEYLLTLNSSNYHPAKSPNSSLAAGSLQKLRNLGISEEQIQNIKKKGKADRLVAISSPIDGIVLEKNVISGMYFGSGEKLYLLADISNLWLVIEIFEKDLDKVKIGQEVIIDFDAYPGKIFSSKVEFIYPTLDPKTRTVKVRIQLPNKENLLKPEMYGTANLVTSFGGKDSVIIPDSAVLDSGIRQMVLVGQKEGEYEPRSVKVGDSGDGYVEILEGLKKGEKVVVQANFLIDAESNLKSALSGFDRDDLSKENSESIKSTKGKNND